MTDDIINRRCHDASEDAPVQQVQERHLLTQLLLELLPDDRTAQQLLATETQDVTVGTGNRTT